MNHSPKSRLLALLAATAVVLAACGGGGDGGDTTGQAGEDEGQPKPGGKVTIALEAESPGFQPGKDSVAEPGTMVLYSVYDPFVLRDAGGTIKPFLAESFESTPDLKEWTFKLRPNVKFHDGTDLNTTVVSENYKILKAGTTAGALATVSEFVVVDPLTFKYVLSVPNAAFPDLLTGVVGMPFSMKNYTEKGADVSANPVGTGPFSFVRWQRDSELLVRKNPSYWIQGLPYLDEVAFKPIPDEDARLATLTSGEVDMMHTLRQTLVKKAKQAASSSDLRTYDFQGNSSGSSLFNTSRPPLDDRRVRQGLAHALSQDDLLEVLGGTGISQPTTQLFTTDSPWYSRDAAAKWPKQDVNKARSLIKSYVDDPARSDKKPVGTPVSFTYNCQPDPSLVELALLYQQYWKAVGVDVTLRQVEQASSVALVVGTPPDYLGDYDAVCWRLGSQNDPDVTLFNAFREPQGNASNVSNFTTPRLQQLLIEGRSTADIERRKQIYGEVSTILAEEVPFTLTGSTAALVAATPKVKGIMNWTFPDRTTKGPSIVSSVVAFREVWLDR